jgi:biopolymer transport protein ExbD
MSRFKGPDVEESVACNLIPMIDIMFLLLLFFMLGADMSQRELEDVVLPIADQATEEAKEKEANEGGRTTVNVFHRHTTSTFSCPTYSGKQVCRELDHWQIAIRSSYYTLETIGDMLKDEGMLELESTPQPDGKTFLSKRHVMIRADENAPYGFIQRVIEACAAGKIYMIEVAAAQPEPTG